MAGDKNAAVIRSAVAAKVQLIIGIFIIIMASGKHLAVK